MVRTEKTKTTALVLTAVCIVLSIVQCATGWPQLNDVGICKGSTILARLSYSFFHASIPHALINGWCLLSAVFIYDVPISSLIIAYITAVTFPIDTISTVCCGTAATTPTVGLSAVCFSLLGQVAFQVRRKMLFHAWILSFIAVGFILPPLCSLCGYAIASPNNILHLYCYVAGLLVGFLNSPAHHAQ